MALGLMRFRCEECGLDMVLLERPEKCFMCESRRITMKGWQHQSCRPNDRDETAQGKREISMRLCVPTMEDNGLDDRVSAHFGRAPTFTLVDLDSGEVQTVKNAGEHMGGMGKPSEHVARAGAEIVICSGLGPKAIDVLKSSGIEVYVGAKGTVREAIQMWRDGKLEKASKDTACREHHH